MHDFPYSCAAGAVAGKTVNPREHEKWAKDGREEARDQREARVQNGKATQTIECADCEMEREMVAVVGARLRSPAAAVCVCVRSRVSGV